MKKSTLDIKKYKSQYDDYMQERDRVVNNLLKVPYKDILVDGLMHAHGSYNLKIKIKNQIENEKYESQVEKLRKKYENFFNNLWEDIKKEAEKGKPKSKMKKELAYLDIFNKLDRANIPVWASPGGLTGFYNHTSYPIGKFTKMVKKNLKKGKRKFLLEDFLENYGIVIGESLLSGSDLSVEAFLNKKERNQLNKQHGPDTHYDRINKLCDKLLAKGVIVKTMIGY